jgi:hypothetical protein
VFENGWHEDEALSTAFRSLLQKCILCNIIHLVGLLTHLVVSGHVYMMYVQASQAGAVGWPMSVFLTPELKPIVGGTYFHPDDKYGCSGF